MLWASLPVPAFLLSGTDRIAATNPAAEGFLNLSAKALLGVPIRDRVMIDAPLEEAFARVRADQAPLFINDVAVGGGGRAPQSGNLQIAPYGGRNEAARGGGTQGAGQVLLLISPRDLVGHARGGRSMNPAAKSAIGMAEMLAHEIKNPLAGITGAAQLLAMNLPAVDREMTDLIVAESRRIVKLLEQVEQVGNLLPPRRCAVNLHDALDRARRSAQVGFGARMVFCEDFDPSLPPTWADCDQLQQVFLNLLKNAAEAAGEGGGTLWLRTYYERSLRLRRKDGQGRALPLQVEIIDDGPGLPPEIADDVFEPFVSGRGNGTGLGLALVAKIISDHGGWISVTSGPGRTVFRISLPVAAEGAPGAASRPAKSPQNSPPKNPRNPGGG